MLSTTLPANRSVCSSSPNRANVAMETCPLLNESKAMKLLIRKGVGSVRKCSEEAHWSNSITVAIGCLLFGQRHGR